MSDEDVVRHEGYDSRTCLRCGKRGEDTPEGRLHYSKFNNGNFCRGCAGHPSPTAPSGAEPRSGDTPPGAGADLLPGPCAICGLTNYPLSFGGPTICPSCDCGDSGPYVISRQATDLRRLGAEVERLRASNHDLARERDGAKVAIDRMIQEHAATMRQALEDRVNEVTALRAEVGRLREDDRRSTDRMVVLALAKDTAERRGAERALEVVEAMRENGECDLRQVIHRLRALFPATLGGTP